MRILFLSNTNSGRSQMAEGLARSMLPFSVQVESAGIKTTLGIHPMAVKCMKETGIDISRNKVKSVGDLKPEFVDNLDFVIIVSATPIPTYFHDKVKILHWQVPDPKTAGPDEMFDEFRVVREDLRSKIEDLVDDLQN